MDYFVKEREFFDPFIDRETFDDYVTRLRRDGEWGDNFEVQIMANLYGYNIGIFYDNSSISNVTISPNNGMKADKLIRLHYKNGNRYTSIVPREGAASIATINNGNSFHHQGTSVRAADEKDGDVDQSWMSIQKTVSLLTSKFRTIASRPKI